MNRSMPSTAGATIGIPPVRAVDEADLSVRQPRDEERNLQLSEEVYQMESVFPRNIYLGTHDWGQVLVFEGDFCLPFRLFTRYLKKRVKIKVSVSFLGLHEEICSKNSILIWRFFRHFLTRFPLLNNLVVLEAKDVYQRNPRTIRREPNSPVNCHQISIFKSTHRFKFLLGEFDCTFFHPS